MDSSHEGEIDPVRASKIHEHNFYDSPLTCESASCKSAFAIARASLPFFFLLVVAVAIITAFPQIVMWLPKYVFPG